MSDLVNQFFNLTILINPPHLFFSCIDLNWQEFYFRLLTYFSLNSSDVKLEAFFFLSLEFFAYLVLIGLLAIFGWCYSTSTAFVLLSRFTEVTRYIVEFIFIILCFQVYYCAVNPEILLGSGISFMNETYHISYFTQCMKLVASALWLGLFRYADTTASDLFLSAKHQGLAELPLLSLLILNFSFTLISANNLALLLISLEGLSLILYILATLSRLNGGITSAAKYFAFGTAGSVLFFWGLSHIYGMLGSLSMSTLFYVSEIAEEFFTLQSNWINNLEWTATLILVGFLIKLGAAPMHQWIADVYSGVPLFITALYAIFIKFVLYVVFIRFSYFLLYGQELEYAAVLSLIVGVLGTLRQTEIKRFLAYGSIVHVGFLLSGDLVSSFVYLISYLIASLLLFSILLQARFFGRELIYLSDLRLLSQSNQSFKFFAVIAFASMAGLPPFAGFYGKMMIWSSLLEDIYLFNDFMSFFMLLSNLFLSLVIISYYMKLIILIFLGTESESFSINRNFTYSFMQAKSICNHKSYIRADLSYSPLGYFKSEQAPIFTILNYIKLRNMDFFVVLFVLASVLVLWTLIMPLLLTILHFILSSVI